MARAIVNIPTSGNIGDIKSSMMTLAQFQALNGTNWILANGSSAAGTKYNIITGNANVPDLRGRTIAGVDNMGGVAAGILTAAGSGIASTTLGASGGAETHTLTSAQSGVPAHSHGIRDQSARNPSFGGGSIAAYGGNVMGATIGGQTLTAIDNTAANASQAHQNTQPTIVMNYFIKVN